MRHSKAPEGEQATYDIVNFAKDIMGIKSNYFSLQKEKEIGKIQCGPTINFKYQQRNNGSIVRSFKLNDTRVAYHFSFGQLLPCRHNQNLTFLEYNHNNRHSQICC